MVGAVRVEAGEGRPESSRDVLSIVVMAVPPVSGGEWMMLTTSGTGKSPDHSYTFAPRILMVGTWITLN